MKFLNMLNAKRTKEIISLLEEIQKAELSLAEATKLLYQEENVPFDDIWPAIMVIEQISEKQALQRTKDWCLS